MPAEIRPLFRPDAIRPHLTAFVLPPQAEAARAKLQHWRKLLESGKADQLTEKELLPDFLTDIFGELLGYAGPASGGTVNEAFGLTPEEIALMWETVPPRMPLQNMPTMKGM